MRAPLIKPRYHGTEMERLLRDLRSAQKRLVKINDWIKAKEIKVIPGKHTYDLMFVADELEHFVDQLEWLRVDRVDKDGKE